MVLNMHSLLAHEKADARTLPENRMTHDFGHMTKMSDPSAVAFREADREHTRESIHLLNFRVTDELGLQVLDDLKINPVCKELVGCFNGLKPFLLLKRRENL
jgi:hypothetical protein